MVVIQFAFNEWILPPALSVSKGCGVMKLTIVRGMQAPGSCRP